MVQSRETENCGDVMRKIATCLIAYFCLAGAAQAGKDISIDTRDAIYSELPNVKDTTVESDEEIRIAGATQCAATYRTIHGLLTLPTGKVFTIKWQDGSSEKIIVIDPLMTTGASPVRGTQQAAAAKATGLDSGIGDSQ